MLCCCFVVVLVVFVMGVVYGGFVDELVVLYYVGEIICVFYLQVECYWCGVCMWVFIINVWYLVDVFLLEVLYNVDVLGWLLFCMQLFVGEVFVVLVQV